MTIRSVCTTDAEILNAINRLYLKNKGFDFDPTYSRGNFYKNSPEPRIKSDLEPKFKDVLKMDCRKIELANTKIKSIIFDPPFLIRTGTTPNKSLMCNRYGFFETKLKMIEMYSDSLKEFRRVLSPKGILVFKCQDYSNGRQNHFIHTEVQLLAEKTGFKAIDLFIKFNRSVIPRQGSKQGMARKVHSYFWVFRKV